MEYIAQCLEERLAKTLERGKSVLLLGAWQTGKTTLAQRLEPDMMGQKWIGWSWRKTNLCPSRSPDDPAIPRLNHGVDLLPARCYHFRVRTLTIKLEPGQNAWLERQAKALKRSKGGIIRDLIHEQQSGRNGSLGQALADLRGCLTGSKGLSTRRLKGYGRG